MAMPSSPPAERSIERLSRDVLACIRKLRIVKTHIRAIYSSDPDKVLDEYQEDDLEDAMELDLEEGPEGDVEQRIRDLHDWRLSFIAPMSPDREQELDSRSWDNVWHEINSTTSQLFDLTCQTLTILSFFTLENVEENIYKFIDELDSILVTFPNYHGRFVGSLALPRTMRAPRDFNPADYTQLSDALRRFILRGMGQPSNAAEDPVRLTELQQRIINVSLLRRHYLLRRRRLAAATPGFSLQQLNDQPLYTMLLDVNSLEVEVPTPPDCGNSTSCKCPFCHQQLSCDVVNDYQRWTAHVFRDFYPQTCIAEGCTDPHAIFLTKKDWMHHLAYAHHEKWKCLMCDDTPVFDSRTEYSLHVRSAHRTVWEVERQNEPLNDMVDGAPGEVMAVRSCPLCPFAARPNSWEMATHVHRHVMNFSLFSFAIAENETSFFNLLDGPGAGQGDTSVVDHAM